MQIPFNTKVDDLFLAIEHALEHSAPDLDFDSQGGMLNIELPPATVILSRQPALKEVWLACPEGGFHFHYQEGQWITKRGEKLFVLLANTIAKTTGILINFEQSEDM